MLKTIKIRKGLNIKLKGTAEISVGEANSAFYGIRPSDFQGVTPKLCVQANDIVKVGSTLFYDKNRPEVKFASPVSGRVVSVNRGERRRILAVEIESDGKFNSENFSIEGASSWSQESIKQLLLESGLWPFIIQRPFGIIADPADTPRDIFVSGFDSAPLAPDYDYTLNNDISALQAGIDVLAKLTDGKVYLGVRGGSKLADVKNAEVNVFEGPHPAGNVGVQIHQLKPIDKGVKVWTVDPQAVVFIGRLFANGKLNMSKIVALTGSEVKNPMYYKTVVGAKISSIVSGKTKGSCKERIISGNVLTGLTSELDDFIGFYHNQITVIPEGDNYEFIGWAMPRFNKFSMSRAYFSWLMPGKTYRADANLNGEERAYVMTGQYEKVLPMNILPVHLIKSIMADDIEKMEQLGIYEVIEEDFALCEYVCTSKIEVQHILRKGINLIVKELG